MEDDKETLPSASDITAVRKAHPIAVVTLVDVDFAEYRRRNDMRTVRRERIAAIVAECGGGKSGLETYHPCYKPP